MKNIGVVYDVGLSPSLGSVSVDHFHAQQVNYDIDVIARQFKASTIRIQGESISRLVIAAEEAHNAKLHILFNPWKVDIDATESIAYMADAAAAAEKLRKKGIDIVFVTGCEYSIFNKGVFPGATFNERVEYMIVNFGSGASERDRVVTATESSKKLNEILKNICEKVRINFKGPVTYAPGMWENVDWNIFDFVGIDYYRGGASGMEYNFIYGGSLNGSDR